MYVLELDKQVNTLLDNESQASHSYRRKLQIRKKEEKKKGKPGMNFVLLRLESKVSIYMRLQA